MKRKNLAALTAAFAVAVTMTAGCAAVPEKNGDNDNYEISDELLVTPEEKPDLTPPEVEKPETPDEQPKPKTIPYISVTTNNVNIRSGAGTGYAVLGTAEKSTLYACLGEENGWYITKYKNKTVYISKKYCVIVDMQKAGDEVEAVIAEGTRFMGVPYVYGAVRLHDGKGNKLKGFSSNAFDCSSLMQYMYYYGADTLLDVTTRTQVKQGKTVAKSDLKRGDLMFFTNATRKDKVGIERIGHVAMYLGDNWILHTASDYAKIEQISSKRWSYFIQGQRIL